MVSPDGRDDVVVREERSFARLSRQRVPGRPAAGASLGTGAARPAAPRHPAPPGAICAVAAEALPDLASRLRRGLAARGVAVGVLASASEGRFTVVTARLEVEAHEVLRALATELGARVSFAGGTR